MKPEWEPKPASGTPARRYSWETFTEGNTAAFTHGAMHQPTLAPLAEKWEARLREVAPWADRPAFAGALRSLAYAEAELQLRRAWLCDRGLWDEEGNDRRGMERLERCEARAAKLRDALGVTVQSYARLIATITSAVGPDEDAVEALRIEGRRILDARTLRLASSDDDGGSPGAA